MSSGILTFTSCRLCITAGRRPRLHVGLIDPTTLRVWCAACDKLVADFPLAIAMPMHCDVCHGEIVPGQPHKH